MICPGQAAVLRHAQVGIQLFDMPWMRHSFTTYSGRDVFFMTCPGRDTVIRHTQVGMQFYDIHGSECNLTTSEGMPWTHNSLQLRQKLCTNINDHLHNKKIVTVLTMIHVNIFP